ncbi:MAG: hypothetical protein WC640_00295 [Candidatus Paceibacterota bacterium]|jgi:hypothetical protein
MKSSYAFFVLVLLSVAVCQTVQADGNPFEGCYWIRGLDVPAWYWEMPEGDQLAGPCWDGGLLVWPLVLGERTFYFNPEYLEWHFVWTSNLAGDPRDTDWWEWSRLNFRGKTLWSRVTNAARSKNCPAVTLAIINDMVKCGIVTQEEVDAGKFTAERLDQIMLEYSELVWD